MFSRITNNMIFFNALYHLTRNGRNIWRLQAQTASGKRILEPSDDPIGMMMAIRFKGQLERFQQYKRNIDFGLRWLNYTESVLNDLEELINRAREVAVTQASDTASADTREASAAYIRGLRETVLQLANSTYEGRYIFSGLSGNQAYQDDGTYLGDTQSFQIAVSEGVYVRINLTGPEVFGTTTNLIQDLDRFSQALEANDLQGISQALDYLDEALNRVIEARSQVGAWYSQLESYRTILNDRTIKITESLSEIVDADLAKVISELSSRELAYRATLLATRRLFDETLISLLR